MTIREAFPREMAGLVAAGFDCMILEEPIKVKDFRTGHEAVVRTSARFQNEAGEEVLVPVDAVLNFGRPAPVLDNDN